MTGTTTGKNDGGPERALHQADGELTADELDQIAGGGQVAADCICAYGKRPGTGEWYLVAYNSDCPLHGTYYRH